MFDKRAHSVFVSAVAHVLLVVVLCQLRAAPLKRLNVSVTNVAATGPLWMFTNLDRPAPVGPGPTESPRPSGIVPDSVSADQSAPAGNDDAVPPVDTEATDIRNIPESSAPVVRLNLKNIPRLDLENQKPVAVQPAEFFSSSADAIGTENPKGITLEPAHAIKQVIPDYPYKAKVARVQGQVLLKATITETGTVEDIVVMEGHPLLIDAAVAAVRRWRYEPARLHGVPTRSPLDIRVNFRLTFDQRQ